MAGPCACHSPCLNPHHACKDELAGAAPTEGSETLIPTRVVLRAPIPAPAIAPAIALSLDNELFKPFMKVYLKA